MKKKEQDMNECVVNEACLLSISKSRVIVDSEIERLNQTIKSDPVFSSREYIDAFMSFRKGLV